MQDVPSYAVAVSGRVLGSASGGLRVSQVKTKQVSHVIWLSSASVGAARKMSKAD